MLIDDNKSSRRQEINLENHGGNKSIKKFFFSLRTPRQFFLLYGRNAFYLSLRDNSKQLLNIFHFFLMLCGVDSFRRLQDYHLVKFLRFRFPHLRYCNHVLSS